MEAELKSIAERICAHFELPPVGVSIADLDKALDGCYEPPLAGAAAKIFISSTHDPCRSMEDILLHELAHHLQHHRKTGSAGNHGKDFFQAILDVVVAHHGDPLAYDWFFDCISCEFSYRLRRLGVDI